MSDVDNRVVELELDNSKFNKRVDESVDSLNKLDKGLELKGATENLDELSKSSKRFSLSNISNGIQNVTGGLAGLVFKITALQRVSSAAISAGKRLVSAFTIDPIKSGFQEYETQINAVQTILANTSSKGKNLNDVNKALDELNKYADKTIYNFTEMTRNIGTFTAAGIDLDTSVAAIKGIANLAAVSGSTSQQASTAMYQLSQALASGTVKLMDWNSVVNAGMGGQVFQDALKDTARVHGIEIDKIIEKQGSFRESLSEGWLSSTILTETLQKFTGDLSKEQLTAIGYTEEQVDAILKMGVTANDAATKVKTFTQLMDTLKEAAQSGWTQSWEIIIGDFEEAKATLTSVSNAFGDLLNSSSEARNSMLQGWKDLGGRSSMIQSAKNAYEGLLSIIKPIKEALRDIFPKVTSQQLYDLTKRIENFTSKIKISDETADKLRRTFKGLFSIISLAKKVVGLIVDIFAKLLTTIAPAGGGILSLTAGIGDLIEKLDAAVSAGGAFQKIIDKIGKVLQKVIGFVKTFASKIVESVKGFSKTDTSDVDKFSKDVTSKLEPLKKITDSISKVFDKLTGVFKKVANILLKVGKTIAKVVIFVVKAIGNALSKLELPEIGSLINSGFLAALILGINNFVKSLTSLSNSVGGTFNNINGFLSGFKNVMGSIQATLKEFQGEIRARAIKQIAISLAILAGSALVLSMIDTSKLVTALAAIGTLMIEISILMKTLNKIELGKGINAVSRNLLLMSVAVTILASAAAKFSSTDWQGVLKGLVGITGLMIVMVKAADYMSKAKTEMVKGAGSLILVATSVAILSKSVKTLSEISFGGILKSIAGILLIFATVATFATMMEDLKINNSSAFAMISIATSMVIFSAAIKQLADVNVKAIIKSVAAFAAILAIVGIFNLIVSEGSKFISSSVSLVVIASSMLIFAKAIEYMGSLNLFTIVKGLYTMALALAAITVSLKLMPNTAILSATTLVLAASAMVIFAKALSSLASIDTKSLVVSLAALVALLASIVVAMKFMQGGIGAAFALLIVSAAIKSLSKSLKLLSAISVVNIVKGVITLVAMIAIFAGAAYLLSPVIPLMVALGATLLVLAAACLALGVGLLALAGALTIVVGLGDLAAVALRTLLVVLVGMIPAFVKSIADGFILILESLSRSGEAIMTFTSTLLNAILQALIDIVPPLLHLVEVILRGILDLLANNIEFIVTRVIDILEGILNALNDNLPRILNMLVDFLVNLIITLANVLEEKIPVIVKAVVKLAKAIIKGLITGLFDGVKDLKDAVIDIGQTVIDKFKNVFGIHSPSRVMAGIGAYMDEGLQNGIEGGGHGIINSVNKLTNGIVSSFERGGDDVNSAFSSLSSALLLSDEIDDQPVITPVIDLTNVREGAQQMNSMLTGKTLALGRSINTVRSAFTKDSTDQNGSGSSRSTNYNFTQNNYSPKSLSRVEIYRQTNNQFKSFERRMSNA